jgi:hypothetical protein
MHLQLKTYRFKCGIHGVRFGLAFFVSSRLQGQSRHPENVVRERGNKNNVFHTRHLALAFGSPSW